MSTKSSKLRPKKEILNKKLILLSFSYKNNMIYLTAFIELTLRKSSKTCYAIENSVLVFHLVFFFKLLYPLYCR